MTNLYEHFEGRPYPPPHQKQNQSKKAPYLFFLIIILIGLGYLFLVLKPEQLAIVSSVLDRPTVQSRAITPAGALNSQEQATISVFKNVSNSVVFITRITQQLDFYTLRALEVEQGTGSGFIWDKQGHVVTNFHVIARSTKVSVTCADQTTYTGQVVGTDPDHDLAVIKIDAPASKLHPVQLGTSTDLQVGQSVLAIGNPFGFDSTLTTGIISALDRAIRSETTNREIRGVIQTDAAINPGNSGGPLLDSSGRLIGVNTAIVSPSGAYAGIGFAIPVDMVNRIVPQLISKGRVSKAGLGVDILSMGFHYRNRINGAVIANVARGSAAENAGLRGSKRSRDGIILGDIITAIDGEEINTPTELTDALTDREVGEEITIEYYRNKRKKTVKVALQDISQ